MNVKVVGGGRAVAHAARTRPGSDHLRGVRSAHSEPVRIDVRMDPWKTWLIVLVGGAPAAVQARVARWGIENNGVGDQQDGHCWVHAGRPVVLWMRRFDILVLVHEAIHGVSGLLEMRGVKLSADSEEALTYSVEHVLRKVLASKKWKGAR